MSADVLCLKARARALFRLGWNLASIADVVDRSKRTVVRWKKEDREDGVDWDERREQYLREGPGSCLAAVQRHRAKVAEDPDLSETERVEALRKLGEVVRDMEAEIAGVRDAVTALARLRSWARRQGITEEEFNELERDIGAYLCDRYGD